MVKHKIRRSEAASIVTGPLLTFSTPSKRRSLFSVVCVTLACVAAVCVFVFNGRLSTFTRNQQLRCPVQAPAAWLRSAQIQTVMTPVIQQSTDLAKNDPEKSRLVDEMVAAFKSKTASAFKGPYGAAACAVVKDSAKYIREWVIYHYLIGVQHIYVYDNNSTDSLRSTMQPLIDRGMATYINWPGPKSRSQWSQVISSKPLHYATLSAAKVRGFIETTTI
jgi:hypothetical protein